MQHHGKRRLLAEMNVVPYIDVMLVLLIIFMITTPLLSRGVDVELPKANAQPLKPKEMQEPIILSVDAQGQFFLNLGNDTHRALAPEEVQSQVASALQRNAGRPVLVQGDARSEYGRIVAGMVLLQQAGATSVGILADPAGAKRGDRR